MNDEHELHEVDRRVRELLQPDEATRRRIVAAALAESGPHQSRRSRIVTAFAVAAVASLGVYWFRSDSPTPPIVDITIAGTGTSLSVQRTDGIESASQPPATETIPPDGGYVIVVHTGGSQ